MEELNKQTGSVFMTETLFDGQAEQGVELDHVLPDYYPEIFKILKCCITPRVTSAAVSGGKLMLDGCAVIRVLYLAENSNAVNCVEQRYTWSRTVDIAKAGEMCSDPVINVVPRTDYCNCRAVSSRRIDVRGAISFRITVCCTSEFPLPALPDGLQVLRREIPCTTRPLVTERQVTVREEIETGAPGVEYIVSCDAVPHVGDVRIIANKAVVKGTVTVSALYGVHTDEHPGCDELEKMTADIPISQIIDMPGLTDQHSCRTEFTVRSCELIPSSGSGVISCELLLGCRCTAVCSATAEIPCDVYSTEYECASTSAALRIPTAPRSVNGQFQVKSSVSCGSGEIESVWDCRSDICNVIARPDGDALLITGQLCVQAVGRCSGGVPFFEEKQEAFEQRIPAGDITQDTGVSHRTVITGTGFAIRSDGTLDITAQAEFTGELTDAAQISAISSAAILEDKPREKCGDYSLRICYTSANESCWDIAKRCSTTVEAVMIENGIDDRDAQLSGMIIIPMV